MRGSAGKIQLASLEDFFGAPPPGGEAFQEIPLAGLHPFKGHPFHVTDDEKMQEMAESVGQHGILVPGIVRPRPEGGYELVSGHRRKRACELAGLDTMPVFVRDLDDDEAVLIMVDSNLQRERILPSEKAFAYRMKLDAMKRQGKRKCMTSVPVGQKLGQTSREMLAANSPDSNTQIQRYIRLTYLLPALALGTIRVIGSTAIRIFLAANRAGVIVVVGMVGGAVAELTLRVDGVGFLNCEAHTNCRNVPRWVNGTYISCIFTNRIVP